MELKEAKNILEGRKSLLINSSMPDISLVTAIDTVLEELNNRIPRKDIEDKIEELENIKLCGGAVNKAICEEKIQLLKNILKWRN